MFSNSSVMNYDGQNSEKANLYKRNFTWNHNWLLYSSSAMQVDALFLDQGDITTVAFISDFRDSQKR